eukprot:3360410-Heterocapsa_arctica.AAC.1
MKQAGRLQELKRGAAAGMERPAGVADDADERDLGRPTKSAKRRAKLQLRFNKPPPGGNPSPPAGDVVAARPGE